jgi:hypothetical protein
LKPGDVGGILSAAPSGRGLLPVLSEAVDSTADASFP